MYKYRAEEEKRAVTATRRWAQNHGTGKKANLATTRDSRAPQGYKSGVEGPTHPII